MQRILFPIRQWSTQLPQQQPLHEEHDLLPDQHQMDTEVENNPIKDRDDTNSKKPSFKELLDESLLMQFGRPDGKCVVGRITHVCNDDLYVDFGAKFEAVVKKPPSNDGKPLYEKGSLVRLILNKFEMTGAFLGDPRHITLCEADALLIGPYVPRTEQENKTN